MRRPQTRHQGAGGRVWGRLGTGIGRLWSGLRRLGEGRGAEGRPGRATGDGERARIDPARPDAIGPEASRPGAARLEAARLEAARLDPGRIDFTLTPNLLTGLARQACERGTAGAFLDRLLAEPATGLAHLRGQAAALSLAGSSGRQAEVRAALANRAARPDCPPPRLLPADQIEALQRGHGLDPADLRLLARCKYRHLTEGPADSLAAAAGLLAPALQVEPPVRARLLALRQDGAQDVADWDADLRFGIAADHLVADLRFLRAAFPGHPLATRIGAELQALVPLLQAGADPGAAGPRGRLLVTFHSGHLAMTRHLFDAAFPAGVILGAGKSRLDGPRRQISSDTDGRAALFSALRLMQEGETLMMAADGRKGAAWTEVPLFGGTLKVAESPAFLIAETGCSSAFFSFRFDGSRFVPHLVPGPGPEPGESYRAFRHRWAVFYAGEIEALFRGPARSIAPRLAWYDRLTGLSAAPGAKPAAGG